MTRLESSNVMEVFRQVMKHQLTSDPTILWLNLYQHDVMLPDIFEHKFKSKEMKKSSDWIEQEPI